MKKTQKETTDLSLQERMLLALRHSSHAFRYYEGATYASLAFLSFTLLAIYGFNEGIKLFGTIEELAECTGPNKDVCYKFIFYPGTNAEDLVSILYDNFILAEFVIFLVIGILIIMTIWNVIKGRRVKKDLNQLKFDYTNQAYFFVLSTSSHGNTDVPMAFLNIAENIFPELKREEIQSLEKTGKEFEVDDITIVDDEKKKRSKKWRFNIVAKTKEGYFLVRYFNKKTVTTDDIKETIKIAKSSFKTWTKGVFRLVCLAKSFDNELLEKYDEVLDKEVPLDLILVTENAFSFAKIGREFD